MRGLCSDEEWNNSEDKFIVRIHIFSTLIGTVTETDFTKPPLTGLVTKFEDFLTYLKDFRTCDESRIKVLFTSTSNISSIELRKEGGAVII